MKKENRYNRIISQLNELFVKTQDPCARLSTALALLYHKISYFNWVGFYKLVKGELTVSCYQGKVACLILPRHTGVCWEAIDNKKIVIVSDVNTFKGHIACDTKTLSEIVLPIFDSEQKIIGVLDIDSYEKDSFDATDALYLSKIIALLRFDKSSF